MVGRPKNTPAKTGEKTKTAIGAKKTVVKPPVIPYYPENGNDTAIRALKLYTDLEEVYIDHKGSIYPAETFTRGLSQSAKLYTNPFYKKQ